MFADFLHTPPVYAQLVQEMKRLGGTGRHARVFSLGRSVLGRELYALRFGSAPQTVLLTAGIHAQEWLTVLLLLRFAGDFVRCLAARQTLAGVLPQKVLENRSVVIVPCVNPDGTEIALTGAASAGILTPQVQRICGGDPRFWQANARGVDLNHNFDAGFAELRAAEREAGITGPAPSRYGGPFPHSEPETRAIVRFVAQHDVQRLYAFHAQGEEIYYDYRGDAPYAARLIAKVLAASSGYRLAVPSGTARYGGMKDWFIDRYRRPGFTVEIGRGSNPLPIEELEPIYARLIELLLLSTLL